MRPLRGDLDEILLLSDETVFRGGNAIITGLDVFKYGTTIAIGNNGRRRLCSFCKGLNFDFCPGRSYNAQAAGGGTISVLVITRLVTFWMTTGPLLYEPPLDPELLAAVLISTRTPNWALAEMDTAADQH